MPAFPGGGAPDGQMPGGGAPDGTNFVKVVSIENGSITVEIGGMPEQDAGTASETETYDLAGAEILKETAPGQTEAATEADITSDSMIELELNEDGSIKTLTIKAKPENMPEGQAPNGQMPQAPSSSEADTALSETTEQA